MGTELTTNINGFVYDLNDGGDICHVCDKHLANCEEHTLEELFYEGDGE
jgi:hypothetical protein